jgi:integrase
MAATLQEVVDRILASPTLPEVRKRDLRSAVVVYGKLAGQPLSAIPLDLAALRETLDGMVPAQAKVSRKRFANLRSDLAAAIAASGFVAMLKTADVELDQAWASVLEGKGKTIANGLSRLARWASVRRIGPQDVNDAVLERFFLELEAASLVRNIPAQRRYVAITWNKLAALQRLQRVTVPNHRPPSGRVPWNELPAAFQQEVKDYLTWCRVPDPLDESARARALAPETVRLRRDHIHLAASAACAAGLPIETLSSLGGLAEPEVFKTLLRQRWQEAGEKFTAYTRDVAITLIAIATEWVKIPAAQMDELKQLRKKLGSDRRGFAEKNQTLLRRFDDPRLVANLIAVPDTLWRNARRNLKTSKQAFVDLQTALAIDILLHVPLRIENLWELRFDEHLHWPQGPGKPALLVIASEATKNDNELEFELPAVLANRLYAFRHDIATKIIGKTPDHLFVSRNGERRARGTLRLAIQKGVRRRLGVKLSPHQFRHLSAKFALDANPGAYEHVRQLLGHKEMKTTTNFYAGVNTRRAGRAHAALIAKLRENRPFRSARKPMVEME